MRRPSSDVLHHPLFSPSYQQSSPSQLYNKDQSMRSDRKRYECLRGAGSSFLVFSLLFLLLQFPSISGEHEMDRAVM